MTAKKRRILIVVLTATVALGVLACVVIGWSRLGSGRTRLRESQAGKREEVVPESSPENRIRAALDRDVSFPGYEADPKMTLADVLESLGKQWDVRFDVRGEKADDILRLTVVETPIPARSMPAEWVLWLILQRIPSALGKPGFLGYIVDKDHIVIAPEEWFAEREIVPQQPAMDTPRMLAKAKALREKLSRVIAFPGIKTDPRMTLADFLQSIHRRWGLKSFVDERAFRREGLPDVMRYPITETPLPRIKIQLAYLIDRILARISTVPSGATFAIIGDHLYIGTNAGFQTWGIESASPPQTTESMKRQFKNSRAVLARTVDFQGVSDPKATLGEALDLLATTYRLTIEIDERRFKRIGMPEVLKTAIAEPVPIPRMKAPLTKVLEVILDRIPLPIGCKATYVVPSTGQSAILVTVSEVGPEKDANRIEE